MQQFRFAGSPISYNVYYGHAVILSLLYISHKAPLGSGLGRAFSSIATRLDVLSHRSVYIV